MELKATKVREIFLDCLFEDGEEVQDFVLVEGAVLKVGFNPHRLEAHREDVTALTQSLDPSFFPGEGGGASFLILCRRRDGTQWGEHVNCDELLCLALGLDLVSYLLPRNMWPALPGSVPYLVFKKQI